MADTHPSRIVQGGYDRIVDRYACWISSSPPDTTAETSFNALAGRLDAGALVLDLGCGGGDRIRPLADRFTLTAVDISFQQLQRLRGYQVDQPSSPILPGPDSGRSQARPAT
jgi:SAM-dependent methyltransferase